MFLRCSYFLAKSEADVLINSVLIKRKACIRIEMILDLTHSFCHWAFQLIELIQGRCIHKCLFSPISSSFNHLWDWKVMRCDFHTWKEDNSHRNHLPFCSFTDLPLKSRFGDLFRGRWLTNNRTLR